MMLDFLGEGAGAEHDAHEAIVAAISDVLKQGPRTRDMGGEASTGEIGAAIAERVDNYV
jgi:tartrate dehydrogenase/decarboxylase/D-malate dehydrogenase